VKFLIDECLTPELVAIARARGHGECASTTTKSGWTSWRFAIRFSC
jgi:hypothetical protein